MKINPLTKEQITSLSGMAGISKIPGDNTTTFNAKPFRILANGRAVSLVTRACYTEGSNLWEVGSRAAIYQVLQFMRENNPGIRFRVSYH